MASTTARVPRLVFWILAAVLFGALTLKSSARPTLGSTPLTTAAFPTDPVLSVMTYNVEGLPWPVRLGRDEAIARISERLRALRQSGRQPHVVVLQEAFTDAAKQIGADSGYPYVASGPPRELTTSVPVTPADRAFAAEGRWFKGEAMGKFLDSGLLLLSDYPILAVRRASFPVESCAGYDCLANKGVLMALIKVPGSRSPVAVVDTHLNSRSASHVGFGRSLYAYRRQLETLGDFVRADIPADSPMIVAGDFNVGGDAQRLAAFRALQAGWSRSGSSILLQDVLHNCFAAGRCGGPSRDATVSLAREKDLQIFAPAGETKLTVRGVAVPFGHEEDGTMLSDHVGYIAYYDLSASHPAMAQKLAMGPAEPSPERPIARSRPI